MPPGISVCSFRLSYVAGLLFLLMAAGCSSIIEGTSQEITISTTPADATCVLYRQDGRIGEVTSPATLLVKKTKYDIVVVCVKDGYQQAIYVDHSGTSAASVANLVLSAGVGWAVDSVAGADNKYDSPINLKLLPAEAAAGSGGISARLPERLAGAGQAE